MKNCLYIFAALLIGCSSKSEEKAVAGKWYTYAENGDYMELWLGENRAMSYLSGIDEFLLYDLKREGNLLNFSLIESRIIEEHEFQLNVTRSSDKLFQAIFIGGDRIDSLKTYFIISGETPDLKASLEENNENMQELFSRMEDSHAGHGH